MVITSSPTVKFLLMKPFMSKRDDSPVAELNRWKQLIKHSDHSSRVFLSIYAAVDSCETAQEIWLRVQ
ncbi:hypothetical protein Tco_0652210 [Tanacetum coccineum]|uniref:Uncharacterized protein n=1 Tax=Tanacetum coccineum TaxID=301880 RepID=A0ABQ4WWX8_9ASTR